MENILSNFRTYLETKISLVIFNSLFFISLNSFAQWKTIHFGTFGGDSLPTISELSFITASDGIAACQSINPYHANSNNIGSIITTNDSGLTWTYRLKVDSFSFEKVIHVNTNIALAIGSQRSYNWNWYNQGILARTINSGVTWDTSYFPFHLKTIEKVNDSVIFMTGREHSNSTAAIETYLLKSINRGITWVEIPLSFNLDYISDLKFITDSIGFMTGINSKFYKTTNQGASWTSSVIDSSTNYTIQNISTPSLSKFYLLTSSGSVHSSSDTGSTWNLLSTVNGFGIREVEFVNDSVGFIPGFGIVKTIDGGITWNNQTFSPPGSILAHALNDIFAFSTTTLYSGGSGDFYRTYNAGDTILPTEISDVQIINSFRFYPNPIENNFYLEVEKEKTLKFQLYNTIGQHVEFSVQQNANRYEFSVGHLTKGFYFLKAITNEGQTTIKLIKE